MGASYAYDGGNRLTSLADNVGPGGMQLHSYAYTYDGSGNRKTIAEDGATTTYTYDGDNQLTGATVGTTTTSYSYDAHHNRTAMVTSAAGTTSYSYDAAGIELTQLTDPAGIVTSYAYDDATGNLTSSTRDPSGAHAVTSYSYGANGGQPNVLSGVTKPDGTTVSFSYDADGNRTSTTVTSGTTTTTVKDVYQLGLIAYETDGNGTLLATFTYDSAGVPVSVQVGSDPATAPRSYYVYNGHGDVVALVDVAGATVASYSYDPFGGITSSSESFANGWSNPYRYDGRDRVRYDAETGLYWMSVRAYDPTLGRFLSRDPLGRAPLFFADQPYVYAGNNPLVNVDPSGQGFVKGDTASLSSVRPASFPSTRALSAQPRRPTGQPRQTMLGTRVTPGVPRLSKQDKARQDALSAAANFDNKVTRLRNLQGGLVFSGFWAWINQLPVVQTISVAVASLRIYAQVLRDDFRWQASWRDSWWTPAAVIAFGAATLFVVDVASMAAAVVASFAAYVWRNPLLVAAGVALIASAVIQIFNYGGEVNITINKELNDLK